MVFTLPRVPIIYYIICIIHTTFIFIHMHIYVYNIYNTRQRRFQLIGRNGVSVTPRFIFSDSVRSYFFLYLSASSIAIVVVAVAAQSKSSLQATLIYHFAIRHCHSREITIPTSHLYTYIQVGTYKQTLYTTRGIVYTFRCGGRSARRSVND